jgi:hypothetical protein
MNIGKVRFFGIAIIVAVVLVAGGGQTAGAWNPYPGNFRLLYADEDRFRNYDLVTDQGVDPSFSDWPLTFLFYNNASIEKVKDTLYNLGYFYPGSTKYGRMSDWYDDYFFVGDDGRKWGTCQGQFHHARVYGHPYWRNNYNAGWGFYVVGSSHGDYAECYYFAYFGMSEDVSHAIANDLATVWGEGRVDRDWAYWYNLETYREEGNHIWQSNGNAHYVNVP